MDRYFSMNYDGEFETHATENEARAAAQDIIDTALDDTWPEDMERVCWGEIRGVAVERDRKEHEGHTADEHRDHVEAGGDCDVPSAVDWTCSYELEAPTADEVKS